jgi:tetratricopeptide (TPR) repeat protein
MKRKKKKQKSRCASQPAPGSSPPRKSRMIVVVVGGLAAGACLIAGMLYLAGPKPSPPSVTAPVSNIQDEKKTEDLESLLFGKAQDVPQVKAEALRLGNHTIEKFPQSDAALLLMGSVYGELGDIEKNIAFWERVIRLNPQRADVYDKLAQLVKDQGDVEQALIYWQQGLKVDPRHAKSLWALANAYIERHQAAQAVGLLKRACVAAPRSVRNYYLLGQAYRQLKQYEDALPQYEKAIALDPNHYNALYDLALTYRNLDQPERAKESLMRFQALKKAVKTAIPEDVVSDDLPENIKKLARYYWQAYTIYKTNKQNKQGLPLLKRTIALDPFNTYYQELLGIFYTQYKQYSQAIAVYQHAQDIDPNQALFGVNIGQLYTHMGQPAQAERRFTKTIKDFPDYALGYVELVRLYLTAQKNVTKTIGLAQRAVDLQPSAGNYHLLSWTHLVNGQHPQAIQAIQKAMALAPNNKKFQIHYEQIKNKN